MITFNEDITIYLSKELKGHSTAIRYWMGAPKAVYDLDHGKVIKIPYKGDSVGLICTDCADCWQKEGEFWQKCECGYDVRFFKRKDYCEVMVFAGGGK